MPEQVYCWKCTCRMFYIMLQENGSIEAFCTQNNHKRELVNIPELVDHLYKQESGDSLETYRAKTKNSSDEDASDIETKKASNNTASIDGTSTDISVQNTGRTIPG
jgi:hypothetical protein